MPVTSSSPSIYTLLEVMSMGKTTKLTYEYVKAEFEKEDYILLATQYTSAKTKLKYICPKGHIHSITWDKWKRGTRCPTCYKLIKIPTIENIKLTFEQVGYILLSKEYISSKQKLDYICSSGHKHTITWSNFKQGRRCYKCSVIAKEGPGNCNWKGGVDKLNLPLYETYASQLEKIHSVHSIWQDNLELLGIECTYCKKIFVPKLSTVQCRVASILGTGNGESNFYCSEECKVACPIFAQVLYPKGKKPYKENSRPDQSAWAKLVKERDNYTCQNCGSTEGPMVAHHIDPVVNNPVESADVDNGKTLCKTCDKLAHQTPGCILGELRC